VLELFLRYLSVSSFILVYDLDQIVLFLDISCHCFEKIVVLFGLRTQVPSFDILVNIHVKVVSKTVIEVKIESIVQVSGTFVL